MRNKDEGEREREGAGAAAGQPLSRNCRGNLIVGLLLWVSWCPRRSGGNMKYLKDRISGN